jgi:hypothetical protein
MDSRVSRKQDFEYSAILKDRTSPHNLGRGFRRRCHVRWRWMHPAISIGDRSQTAPPRYASAFGFNRGAEVAETIALRLRKSEMIR